MSRIRKDTDTPEWVTEGEKSTTSRTCARCGEESNGVSPFHPGDLEAWEDDRGVRLCASCWIPALRRRATCAHLRPAQTGEKCLTCTAAIDRLRAQFRAYGVVIEERNVLL